MFVVANLVEIIARILDIGLTLYMWIVIIRALLSWVNPDPYNPIVRFLYRATEPVLRPIRRLIPMGNIGIDISPIIVILVIILLQNFVVRSMVEFAYRLKT
ncbi:MAG: YggT family protein [Deltaproteobacteria bacterium]|nr:YggT family protein [Deltaproteobacteria bacterium]